jgi:hypothetical protein
MGVREGRVAYDGDGYVSFLILDEVDPASDEVPGCLMELPRLRKLMILHRGLTDRALANLAGLTRLEELDVSPTPGLRAPGQEILTDDGLSYLRALESLRKLCYCEARVTDAGMRHLEALHNLEELTLACHQATDEGLKSLANLHRLESLTLFNGPGMTGEGLAAIPDPSSLRKLHLKFATDAGTRAISRFTNLRELSIGGPHLGPDSLKSILGVGNLDNLTIRGAPVDKRAVETAVVNIAGLNARTISGCPITHDAFKHLRLLKELEALSVCGAGVDDASARYLEEFPKLRYLSLGRTSITAASLPHLLRVPTLEVVFVPFSFPMTPERRKQLRDALPRLKMLWTPDGMVELGASTKE